MQFWQTELPLLNNYLSTGFDNNNQELLEEERQLQLFLVAGFVGGPFQFPQFPLSIIIPQKIERGRSEARSDDTSRLKAEMLDNFGLEWDFDCIGHWFPPLGNDKKEWGLGHHQMGRLLCTIDKDWNDPK